MESDLTYVKRKLGSGIFVLTKVSDVTGINYTTLGRIRDELVKSPGFRTVETLKQYFMNASK
jgi:hypothetical protein